MSKLEGFTHIIQRKIRSIRHLFVEIFGFFWLTQRPQNIPTMTENGKNNKIFHFLKILRNFVKFSIDFVAKNVEVFESEKTRCPRDFSYE